MQAFFLAHLLPFPIVVLSTAKCVGEQEVIDGDGTMHSLVIEMERILTEHMWMESVSHMDLHEHTSGHLLAVGTWLRARMTI